MKMRPSQILLICGLAVLLIGCIMSICDIEPYADYVLVAGALLIIFRGGLRAREKNDANANGASGHSDKKDEGKDNEKE